jgi:formyltetrahydrofolate deformylase
MLTGATLVKLDCPDAVGLVARITGLVAGRGWNLLEVHQYTDPVSRWFFCRLKIEQQTPPVSLADFTAAFTPLAQEIKARWTVRGESELQRTALLVSREDHCLADLLWRWRSRELAMDLVGVFSNHEILRSQVEREGLPFFYLPVEGNRERHFRRLAELLEQAGCELVILARYMQILPGWFCEEFAGRIINIHHSFLPAFVGANPYRQAYDRGVKLIGATCHYATEELDSGPIIDQEVVRVEHFHDVADLQRLGRDCEKLALGRGVRYHLEDRVLIHGQRTVVFRD